MDSDGDQEGIGILITKVVHKRKTHPTKILEYKAIKVTSEINNIMEAKVDLENDIEKMELNLLLDETNKLTSRHVTKTTFSNYSKLQASQRTLSEIESFLQLVGEGLKMEE